MGYRDNLAAARDRYAAELAAQQPPPDVSWNEYEEFLVAQIERIQRLLDRYDAGDGENTEVISRGYTA